MEKCILNKILLFNSENTYIHIAPFVAPILKNKKGEKK